MRKIAIGALVCALIFPTTAIAEQYRLVSGDVLIIDLATFEANYTTQVDIDGQVRVPLAGAVAVAGRTLDEVETQIEAAILGNGDYLAADAVVSISAYAPVVIAGDVTAPGLVDYIPRMTVAAALGVTGGTQILGTNRLDLDRAIIENEWQLRLLNLEIMQTVVLVSRLQAELAEESTFTTNGALLAMIPVLDQSELQRLQAFESEFLEASQSRRKALIEMWDEELESYEEQNNLLQSRLDNQRVLANSLLENLANARDLQERGLLLQDRLTQAEQAEANARDRVLSIEIAQFDLKQLISQTRLAQARFLTNSREETLAALRTARTSLDELTLRYGRSLEQQAVLAGDNMGTLLASDEIDVAFSIVSARAGRSGMEGIMPDTVLMPGDTLIVQVNPGTAE